MRERRTKAVQLRRDGMAYQAIADAHPDLWRTAAHVRKDVQRALDTGLQESVRDLVTLEAKRLDRLQLALWDKAMSGDVHAVRELIRLSERRARMLGLDKAADMFARAAEQEHVAGILGSFRAVLLGAYAEQTDPDTPNQ